LREKAPEQLRVEQRLRDLLPEGLAGESLAARLLLLRHLPALRYDPQDPWRADTAATVTDNPENFLRRRDGTVIARPPELSLHLLTHYPAGLQPEPGDVLRQGPDRLGSANRFKANPGAAGDSLRRYGDRVYGRVVRDAGRTWLQYWFWFYFTSGHLLGFQSHEGDWRLLQIGLDPEGAPETVTYPRRRGRPETRPWPRVERLGSDGRESPVVYISPISHAFYFEPGGHWSREGPDSAGGELGPVIPVLEPFGPWVAWPGRWGGMRDSPRGPAFHPAWTHPSRYLGRAPSLERFARRINAIAYPKLLDLDGELTGPPGMRRALIHYRLVPAPLRRAAHLYVTINTDDDEMQVVANHVFEATGASGTIDVPVPPGMESCVVVVSPFSFLRVRGDPLATRVCAND
jgi:hypothetical protein